MAAKAWTLLLAALLVGAPAYGQGWEDPAPAAEHAAEHASKEDYEKALRKLERRRWKSAKRAFEKFIEKWPESPYVAEAAARSGDNCYLGTEVLWKSGPSERRIDVAVMGDGFPIDAGDQKKQEKWAKLCIDVLWSEKHTFSEYRNYFNIYFVRLASLEEGVDPQLSPEQRKKIEEKNKYRRASRKKKTDFNTALDAKAAGPQGQVMCDRGLVYKWLDIAERDTPGVGHDRFVIAFAQFGRLGMGGGGIANVGRPDKSITTHEFGHAFSRLLDEYAINPNPPQGAWGRTIRAANAYASPEEPKKDEVPWAHLLKKRVKGVGIFEGGATFKKGVWRPAASCAMNAGGATGFCPVCREQTIKVIYEYINPIDVTEPAIGADVEAVNGDDTMIVVTPMQPRKHKLEATWYVTTLAVTTPHAAPGEEPEPDSVPLPEDPDRPMTAEEMEELAGLYGGLPNGAGNASNPFRGNRAAGNRDAYASPPAGEVVKGKVLKGKVRRFAFPCGKLTAGRYTVTVEVRDPTKHVVKDEKHLLKERASWTVSVQPKPQAAAPAKKKK